MAEPRDSGARDEWRVVAKLEADEKGHSLGERLKSLDLDDEARKRLGGAVIVTRDGPHLFLYAWHEESAREAERVVRELMEEDGLVGQVELVRWHPVAEEWKSADEPLPESESEVAAEQAERERMGEAEGEAGDYPWEVVIDLQGDRHAAGGRAPGEGGPPGPTALQVPVDRRTQRGGRDRAGQELRGQGSRGHPRRYSREPQDRPAIGFTWLGNLKPGVMRDLGI